MIGDHQPVLTQNAEYTVSWSELVSALATEIMIEKDQRASFADQMMNWVPKTGYQKGQERIGTTEIKKAQCEIRVGQHFVTVLKRDLNTAGAARITQRPLARKHMAPE